MVATGRVYSKKSVRHDVNDMSRDALIVRRGNGERVTTPLVLGLQGDPHITWI